MFLLPAIHLRHGRAVAADGSPCLEPGAEAQARAFEAAGATWLHLYDLDAAAGEPNQWPRLGRLLGDTSCRVQFGGGVRSMTQVQQLLDLGAERVAIGAQAVRNPRWLKEVAHIFPHRVVLRVAVADGVVDGAGEGPSDPGDLARHVDGWGLASLQYHGGPEAGLARFLEGAGQTPVVAEASTWDVATLDRLAAAGVDGAIVAPVAQPAVAAMEDAFARYPSPPKRWPLDIVRAHDRRDGTQGNA